MIYFVHLYNFYLFSIGGIIGSGFAFKIEEKNKIKKFNRLVPASANLIQAWWRMKVAFDMQTENLSRLISVLKAFRPILEIDESASKILNEPKFRRGIFV